MPDNRTYIIEKNDGSTVEIEAASAEQDNRSTRVTFKDAGDNTVGSFINVVSWYVKPAQSGPKSD